eukprot:gene21184-25446_t
MIISMGWPSYFQTRHCPTSNFTEVCYTEMQKHTCMAGCRQSAQAARNGISEFMRCCAPYLVARRYYPIDPPPVHRLRPYMPSQDEILKAKILVVDDSPDNVDLMLEILRDAGYTNVTATMRPAQVCPLHQEHCYDLILLDLQMPELNGFQVMKGLKEIEHGGYLPVLALTAQPSFKIAALEAGARDFISKPFDLMEVHKRIHNMLENRFCCSPHEVIAAQVNMQKSGIPSIA